MNCCKEELDVQRPQVQLVPMVSRIAPQWSGIAVINLKMQELSSQYYIGKYLVLLFYPCNFSFVCPVELMQFNDRLEDFQSLGTWKFSTFSRLDIYVRFAIILAFPSVFRSFLSFLFFFFSQDSARALSDAPFELYDVR